MPTAAEQVWDDMDGQANGVVTMNNATQLVMLHHLVVLTFLQTTTNKQLVDLATQ